MKTKYKDDGGNLVADIQGMLRLWWYLFKGLLQGKKNVHEVEPEIPLVMLQFMILAPIMMRYV